jgi:hypothetical protein
MLRISGRGGYHALQSAVYVHDIVLIGDAFIGIHQLGEARFSPKVGTEGA